MKEKRTDIYFEIYSLVFEILNYCTSLKKKELKELRDSLKDIESDVYQQSVYNTRDK